MKQGIPELYKEVYKARADRAILRARFDSKDVSLKEYFRRLKYYDNEIHNIRQRISCLKRGN